MKELNKRGDIAILNFIFKFMIKRRSKLRCTTLTLFYLVAIAGVFHVFFIYTNERSSSWRAHEKRLKLTRSSLENKTSFKYQTIDLQACVTSAKITEYCSHKALEILPATDFCCVLFEWLLTLTDCKLLQPRSQDLPIERALGTRLGFCTLVPRAWRK